jgi:putative oxidoreductase
LIIIITAIVTTKLPILAEKGFWAMVHEARTDFAMMLLSLFLIIYGAGKCSIDKMILQKSKSP